MFIYTQIKSECVWDASLRCSINHHHEKAGRNGCAEEPVNLFYTILKKCVRVFVELSARGYSVRNFVASIIIIVMDESKKYKYVQITEWPVLRTSHTTLLCGHHNDANKRCKRVHLFEIGAISFISNPNQLSI